jgi:PAS domain S-box-containing protein
MRGDGPSPVEADMLKGLLESVPAATFIDPVDSDRLEYVSPQIEAMFGFPRSDWLGEANFWSRIIHPDDHGYAMSAYRRSLKTGLPYSAEYRVFAATGRAVWVHVQANPVRDPDGRLRALAGVVVDISNRHRAEEGMRDSEARYRALVEASPDAIVVTDLSGRVLMANQSAARLVGAPHAGLLVGRSALESVIEVDRDRAGDALGRVALGDPVRGFEFSIHVDGRTVPVEASGQAITGKSGPEAAILVVRDVSERHEAAAARRDSEAKTRFLATMSHELRTPLNSILGFAQLLSSQDFGSLTDRQERYVEHIEASGRQLLDLVNEVLDLSRVSAGQLDIALATEPLADLLREVVTRLRPVASVKGVELQVAIDAGATVVTDRRRLIQASWNLLSNAIKFTPAGGIVSLTAECADGRCVIRVTDTGIGIPAAARDRIFDEFFQVEQGRARNREGSGIGLALARRLIELMGGTISVESELGVGSTFTVALPAGAYHEPLHGLAIQGGAPPAPGVGAGLRAAGGEA